MQLKHLSRALWRDTINALKFKVGEPLYGELIWIDPAGCQSFLDDRQFNRFAGLRLRQASGLVVGSWPESHVYPVSQHAKVAYCLSHWADRKTWQEAGAVNYMLENIARSPKGVSDNCRNEQDVLNRFSALDEAWQAVQEKGRLMTRQEIFPDNFREVGGILMHLGPGGVPVFSGAGCHRFAMALVLGKPFPAQLGCIHISALDSLPNLRLLK